MRLMRRKVIAIAKDYSEHVIPFIGIQQTTKQTAFHIPPVREPGGSFADTMLCLAGGDVGSQVKSQASQVHSRGSFQAPLSCPTVSSCPYEGCPNAHARLPRIQPARVSQEISPGFFAPRKRWYPLLAGGGLPHASELSLGRGRRAVQLNKQASKQLD